MDSLFNHLFYLLGCQRILCWRLAQNWKWDGKWFRNHRKFYLKLTSYESVVIYLSTIINVCRFCPQPSAGHSKVLLFPPQTLWGVSLMEGKHQNERRSPSMHIWHDNKWTPATSKVAHSLYSQTDRQTDKRKKEKREGQGRHTSKGSSQSLRSEHVYPQTQNVPILSSWYYFISTQQGFILQNEGQMHIIYIENGWTWRSTH